MKSKRRFIVALLLIFAVAHAQAEVRPEGLNCSLTEPPLNAGEIPSHAGIARVYPRAKDINKIYSGCQVLFVPDHDHWIIALIEIVDGDPKRTWAPELNTPAQDACRFNAGAVIKGNQGTCRIEKNSLLLKSYAPSCINLMQALNANGKQQILVPEGCTQLE
jgi:hypothetical protein